MAFSKLRPLGRSGISASAVGLGCWAIGGHFTLDGRPDGWGDVDDAQSIRAIELALDLGCTLFDTADAYGTGHSETVLGTALKRRRADAVIATKFGFTYDAAARALLATDVSHPISIGPVPSRCNGWVRTISTSTRSMSATSPTMPPTQPARRWSGWSIKAASAPGGGAPTTPARLREC